MSVGHTLHFQPEGYLDPHSKFGSQSASRPSPSVGFELRTFQFCVPSAISLCQPFYIKNKKNNIWKIRILLWILSYNLLVGNSNASSVISRVFLGIVVHLCSIYLSGAYRHPLWLRAMIERFLKFRVSRLA